MQSWSLPPRTTIAGYRRALKKRIEMFGKKGDVRLTAAGQVEACLEYEPI
jgi:hypothetical protein